MNGASHQILRHMSELTSTPLDFSSQSLSQAISSLQSYWDDLDGSGNILSLREEYLRRENTRAGLKYLELGGHSRYNQLYVKMIGQNTDHAAITDEDIAWMIALARFVATYDGYLGGGNQKEVAEGLLELLEAEL